MTIKDDGEPFLSRWLRLKQEVREKPAQNVPAKADDAQPAPELPPVDQLNYDSDFKAFMDKRVDAGLRRIALKKLFSDPRFNVTDGLDDYAEDFSVLEDLSKAVVDKLQHARRTLHGPGPEEREHAETPRVEQAATEPEEQAADEAAPSSQDRLETAEGNAQADELGTPRKTGEKDERRG
ncbi:MAG: DUF3306 domain-containing protein [Betaproteobacteria bacterium]|nr:DUF3306 domain-containing protein [Betaproteobacteria bacterium]